MSSHLTEQQIAELLIGSTASEQQAHLENCPACARELADLRGTLAQFSGSVREWSADQMGAEFAVRPERRAHPWLIPSVALVVLLLLGAGVSRVLTFSQGAAPVVPLPAKVVQVASDATLLDEIRIDVSRPIPRDMAPLRASY